MTERSERFNARINIERSILSTVNASRLCRQLPLAGLSAGAIKEWRQRASLSLPTSVVDEAMTALTEVARRTGLLADNSRGVFETGTETDDDGLTELKNKIAEILN